MAHAVTRLNEGTADIMRTDDAQFKRDFRRFGIANGRGCAAIGHWNDIIYIDAIFPCEFSANRLADRIDANTFNDRVWT